MIKAVVQLLCESKAAICSVKYCDASATPCFLIGIANNDVGGSATDILRQQGLIMNKNFKEPISELLLQGTLLEPILIDAEYDASGPEISRSRLHIRVVTLQFSVVLKLAIQCVAVNTLSNQHLAFGDETAVTSAKVPSR